jgi:hypothetical protein
MIRTLKLCLNKVVYYGRPLKWYINMSTDKKKIAAYLADDVGRKFDEFKRVRGIKGDSQALNQLLAEYFGVSESLNLAPSLLSRVEALEASLVRGSVSKARGASDSIDFEEVAEDATFLREEEVAALIQMPAEKLRRMKGSKTEKDFNRWLLKVSKGYGSPVHYSLSGYKYLESPS